jgi:hypothetical protein
MQARWRAARERGRSPRHREAEHVAEVVRGVREERGRVSEHPEHRFERNEGTVHADPDQERPAERAPGRAQRIVLVLVTHRG